MDKKSLLKHLVFLMFFIFLGSILGGKLHLDYTTAWFDMVLHFLGGWWVGLFFVYLFFTRNIFVKKYAMVILCVLLIGILWEVFEFYANNYIGMHPFDIVDTSSDIVLDIGGGLCAILYVWKRQQAKQPR